MCVGAIIDDMKRSYLACAIQDASEGFRPNGNDWLFSLAGIFSAEGDSDAHSWSGHRSCLLSNQTCCSHYSYLWRDQTHTPTETHMWWGMRREKTTINVLKLPSFSNWMNLMRHQVDNNVLLRNSVALEVSADLRSIRGVSQRLLNPFLSGNIHLASFISSLS